MMSPSHKVRRSVVGVLSASLVALGVTACGSAEDSGGEGTDKESVTVAIVTPRTGPLAPTFEGFAEAAQARFDIANEAGGVNGRKIEVVVLDDAADPTKQVSVGRSAIESENAFAIIMGTQVDTMLPYMKQRKVPVLGYPGQPAYASDPNVFGAYGVPPIHYTSTANAQGMKDRGVTKLAVFSHNTPGGVALSESVAKAAKRIGGMEVAMIQHDVPEGSFDATSLALRMKDLGVDGAFLSTSGGAALSILEGAKQQNVGLKTSYATTVRSMIDEEPELLEGTVAPPLGTVSLLSELPAAKEYIASMTKYAPDVDPTHNTTHVGWLAADLFLVGLEKAGDDPTRASFIENLRKVTDYDAGGLLVEPITFGEGVEPNGNPPKCVWFEQVKDGAYVPDPEPTCGELFKLE